MPTERSIEILFVKDCPGLEEARTLVKEAAAALELNLPVYEVEIHDAEEAQKWQFLGSPTLRVRGRDVEIFRHNDRRYGFQCRLYRHPDGSRRHAPSREAVEEALKRYA
jgi:hypothetical protein